MNHLCTIHRYYSISTATRNKIRKTAVMPGFCVKECGSSSTPEMLLPPLWRSCLAKIYCCGPEYDSKWNYEIFVKSNDHICIWIIVCWGWMLPPKKGDLAFDFKFKKFRIKQAILINEIFSSRIKVHTRKKNSEIFACEQKML